MHENSPDNRPLTIVTSKSRQTLCIYFQCLNCSIVPSSINNINLNTVSRFANRFANRFTNRFNQLRGEVNVLDSGGNGLDPILPESGGKAAKANFQTSKKALIDKLSC
jgi:hypothetical protein